MSEHTICKICGSIFHTTNMCQHKPKKYTEKELQDALRKQREVCADMCELYLEKLGQEELWTHASLADAIRNARYKEDV